MLWADLIRRIRAKPSQQLLPYTWQYGRLTSSGVFGRSPHNSCSHTLGNTAGNAWSYSRIWSHPGPSCPTLQRLLKVIWHPSIQNLEDSLAGSPSSPFLIRLYTSEESIVSFLFLFLCYVFYLDMSL
jgi:hypothetical protein